MTIKQLQDFTNGIVAEFDQARATQQSAHEVELGALQGQLDAERESATRLQAELKAEQKRAAELDGENRTNMSTAARLQRELDAALLRIAELEKPPTVPAVSYPESPYPLVELSAIRVGNEDIDLALRRLTSPARVHVPAGLYEFSDFKHSGYGIYAPLCRGIVGDGVNKTVLQMRPNSSTKASQVPVQGSGGTNQLSVLRLGGNIGDKTISHGFTLSQTPQGHLYNGWNHYQNTDGWVIDVLVTGGASDWNAPPGETFINSGYKDRGMTLLRVETDGFTYAWARTADGALTKTKGARTGGSPFGNNASINQRLIDCNFHDSFVSGLTSSFTGMPNTGASPVGWYTENCRMARNASHVTGSGKSFSGINHEGTQGPVRHIRPHIDMLSNPVQSSHMSFGSAQQDNADVEVHDPTWTTSPDWGNGCFSVGMSERYWSVQKDASGNVTYDGLNRWKTPPKVFIGGVQLVPVMWWDNQPKLTGLNPTKQFVIKRS